MINSIKSLIFLGSLISVVLGLTSCSSVDKQQYEVTTLQSVGNALLTLADDKRQLGQYKEALVYYQESEKYALKRNDKYGFGLSQLKRAAVYLKLNEVEKAKELMDAVAQIEQFEPVGLKNSLLYVKAQYQQYLGNTDIALEHLSTLQKAFKNEPEKRIFYQFVSWVYDNSSVPVTTIATGYNVLAELKSEGRLYNIEIFSYAVFQYGKYLTAQNNELAEPILIDAIGHFSMLEQSNKIADCYLLLSDFFAQQNLPEKSQYYQQQAKRITELKVI
ncbi:hypothetical protein KO525_13870 [Psychrosphaera sp. B3R10]|uniref:hypothetical protein n=1 Tax=unclassified Psychrosphaera TaxID=2641570 RepID=UPI001C086DB6|nr:MULTISPECIES: hypothetical protein [unclassified Psychrosphaera]MBU2883435.1 hypothetical protein [Psychrosphaera sp. I2R16]MBU2990471.1 hypothetical protein [Psychrosphaera sp. B3R10]